MESDTLRPGAPHDPWRDRLSEYLDGALKARDRAALEAHLAGCAACAEALAELRAVVARARTLTDRAPAEDLWPGIAAQLTPRGRRTAVRGVPAGASRPWWTQRFELALPQLAAAGMLLVGLSAGGVWLALRGGSTPGVPGPAGPAGLRSPGATAPAPGVATTTGRLVGPERGGETVTALEDARYVAAVAELEQALEAGRGRLDPRTLRVVEENLGIVDRALAEARRAVAADPASLWLRSHLAATMKRKVDLLRSATLLAAAQG